MGDRERSIKKDPNRAPASAGALSFALVRCRLQDTGRKKPPAIWPGAFLVFVRDRNYFMSLMAA